MQRGSGTRVDVADRFAIKLIRTRLVLPYACLLCLPLLSSLLASCLLCLPLLPSSACPLTSRPAIHDNAKEEPPKSRGPAPPPPPEHMPPVRPKFIVARAVLDRVANAYDSTALSFKVNLLRVRASSQCVCVCVCVLLT